MLYAEDTSIRSKIPLSGISGGVNKLSMFALALLSSRESVILIDELENGLFYERYKNYWKIICDIAKKQNHQIFVTSHSKEMLKAISDGSTEFIDDIGFIRLSKSDGGVKIEQFAGDEFQAAMEFGEEVR